jgi:cytoskeleton protein RodZ
MDFGAYLRQIREQRGISLRQIANSTKISMAALEALERNQIDKLPGGIFTRAFVRAYAAEVGLDPEETVRKFLEEFPLESVVAGTPQAAELHKREEAFRSQSQMARTMFWLVVLSLPVALLILYFTLRGGAAAREAAPAVRPAGAPDLAAAEAPAPSAAATIVAPSTAAASAPAAEPEGIALELIFDGPCWVSLRIDGRLLYARLFQAGDRDTRRAREEIVLTVGDAGALRYTLNGRPGRSLGRSGQVVTVRITGETLADYLVP